jgi:phosphatidate cytidylyltransferase
VTDKPRPPEPSRFPPLEGTPGHVPDITTRFAMSVALIAVASLAIWFGAWPFRILVLVGAAIMLAEWADMHKVAWPWTWLGVAMLALLLLGGAEYLFPVGEADTMRLETGEEMWAIDIGTFAPVWTAAGAILAASVLLGLLSRKVSMGWGFLYIALPCFLLVVLSWAAGFGLVFWLMIATWATDIFAMIVGRAIGGPKLIPSISPNKTWAGLFGGILGAGLCGWVAAEFFALGEPFTWLGFVMGAVAQAGDLYESWEKRRRGVKHSGTLLPGHGGVLDRCDGLIAVALATAIVLMTGLWMG